MNNTLATPHKGYELVGAAGIWDAMPPHFEAAVDAMAILEGIEALEGEEPNGEETMPTLTEEQEAALETLAGFGETPPYPYLQLLGSQHPPTKDRPAYRFVTALTATPDEPLIPVNEQAAGDMLHLTVEDNRVMVEDTPVRHDPVIYDPASEDKAPIPTKTVTALLYKAVKPIGFHLPVIEALHRFTGENGVDWNPASLSDIAGMDKDFYHFKTVVPDAEVSLTVDGESHTTTVSALVAAGLRAALCETVRVACTTPAIRALRENPDLLDQYREALLEGDTNFWSTALEAGTPKPKALEQ